MRTIHLKDVIKKFKINPLKLIAPLITALFVFISAFSASYTVEGLAGAVVTIIGILVISYFLCLMFCRDVVDDYKKIVIFISVQFIMMVLYF